MVRGNSGSVLDSRLFYGRLCYHTLFHNWLYSLSALEDLKVR